MSCHTSELNYQRVLHGVYCSHMVTENYTNLSGSQLVLGKHVGTVVLIQGLKS